MQYFFNLFSSLVSRKQFVSAEVVIGHRTMEISDWHDE